MEFIESTMVKYAYLIILKINLKQKAVEFDVGSASYFLQDKDPKFTAAIVKL